MSIVQNKTRFNVNLSYLRSLCVFPSAFLKVQGSQTLSLFGWEFADTQSSLGLTSSKTNVLAERSLGLSAFRTYLTARNVEASQTSFKLCFVTSGAGFGALSPLLHNNGGVIFELEEENRLLGCHNSHILTYKLKVSLRLNSLPSTTSDP